MKSMEEPRPQLEHIASQNSYVHIYLAHNNANNVQPLKRKY